MEKLRKLLTLAPPHAGSLVAAGLLLAQARWKHARQPVGKIINEIKTPINVQRRGNPQRAARIAWALQSTAAVVPWRADCLIRAIAARHWAARVGLPFEFHLGVSFGKAGKLEAHAWSLSGTMFLSGEIPEL